MTLAVGKLMHYARPSLTNLHQAHERQLSCGLPTLYSDFVRFASCIPALARILDTPDVLSSNRSCFSPALELPYQEELDQAMNDNNRKWLKNLYCEYEPNQPTNETRKSLLHDEKNLLELSRSTRTWISSAVDNEETYNTSVMYQCPDGSQFDTNDDGVGDSVTVTIRCLWNKAWHPYPTIPPCIVTHCVEPFNIPDSTDLEELTSDWTLINTKKEYRCKNQIGNVTTKF